MLRLLHRDLKRRYTFDSEPDVAEDQLENASQPPIPFLTPGQLFMHDLSTTEIWLSVRFFIQAKCNTP